MVHRQLWRTGRWLRKKKTAQNWCKWSAQPECACSTGFGSCGSQSFPCLFAVQAEFYKCLPQL